MSPCAQHVVSPQIGAGPSTVSDGTVSSTELRESFGSHRASWDRPQLAPRSLLPLHKTITEPNFIIFSINSVNGEIVL